MNRPLPVLVHVLLVVGVLVALYLWRGWSGIGIAALTAAGTVFWQRVVLKDDDDRRPARSHALGDGGLRR